MAYDAPLHSISSQRSEWYETRSSANVRRRRPRRANDNDTSHLSAEASAQVKAAAAALKRHTAEIRRMLAHQVPLKVRWMLAVQTCDGASAAAGVVASGSNSCYCVGGVCVSPLQQFMPNLVFHRYTEVERIELAQQIMDARNGGSAPPV